MDNIKGFYRFIKESKNVVEISTITPDIEEDCLDVLYKVFGFLEKDKESMRIRVQPRLSNGLSIALSIGGTIIGCYLLNEKSAQIFIQEIQEGKIGDFPPDETKIYFSGDIQGNGIQGIALAIDPEYRDMGFGKILKEWAKNLGYDYIWGVSDKKLENIDQWRKERQILAESPTRWATIQIF